MEYICKPSRLAIYVNNGKKSTAKIKAETGCTALINGGIFDMSTFKPLCHLKVDGEVLAADQWKYFGIGWNDVSDIAMVTDYSGYANYICCVEMVRNGEAVKMIYPADMGGSRQRTAFGFFKDGRIWVLADKTPRTPEQLQELALKAGVEYALMMDGGGSTQGISPNGTVSSSRKVHNFICVWEGTSKEENNSEDKEGESMAVKIGQASSDEYGKAYGGAAGDQTSREVYTRNWYSSPWNLVLRCNDPAKAEKMAAACEQACANNNIGYDQYQRNTLLTQAKAKNWDLSKITVKCECDCSSLMTVCAQCAGIDVPYISGNAPYTGNMRAQFMSTGEFKVLVASKYLTSDAYLKRGDILVRTSGHTAMVLGDGAKANIAELGSSEIDGKIDTVREVQIWLNNNYSSGLTLDGLYGSLTKKALVKALQIELGVTADGIYGPKTNTAVKMLRKGSKGNLVKVLQAFLVCHGQKNAYVDGDFGSGTRDALIVVQTMYRLDPDGIAGKKTFAAMCS